MDADYYDLLGIPETADQEAIRVAYRQQMALYHPDKVAALGAELRRVAEERTKAINAAYSTLGNPAARAVYDRQRSAPPPPPPRPEPPPRPVRPSPTPPPPPPPSRPRRKGRVLRMAKRIAAITLLYLIAVTIAGTAAQAPTPFASALAGAIGEIVLLLMFVGLFAAFRSVIPAARRWRTRGIFWYFGVLLLRTLMFLFVGFFAFGGLGIFMDQKLGPAAQAVGVTMGSLSVILLLQILLPRQMERLWALVTR